MAAREASMASDSVDGGDSVESLIKKHEDFDRAINSQEEKIHALNAFAGQLVNADHYDRDGIAEKRDQVLERWVDILSTYSDNKTYNSRVLITAFVSPKSSKIPNFPQKYEKSNTQ